MLILDIVYDANTGMESGYCLSGDRNRSMGILRFTHEFTVYLRKDLSFVEAESLDCGEASSYRRESEFEARYPGVMRSLREAEAKGELSVRRYHWNKGRNEPFLVGFRKP